MGVKSEAVADANHGRRGRSALRNRHAIGDSLAHVTVVVDVADLRVSEGALREVVLRAQRVLRVGRDS
jgi:hypothetical protein